MGQREASNVAPATHALLRPLTILQYLLVPVYFPALLQPCTCERASASSISFKSGLCVVWLVYLLDRRAGSTKVAISLDRDSLELTE